MSRPSAAFPDAQRPWFHLQERKGSPFLLVPVPCPRHNYLGSTGQERGGPAAGATPHRPRGPRCSEAPPGKAPAIFETKYFLKPEKVRISKSTGPPAGSPSVTSLPVIFSSSSLRTSPQREEVSVSPGRRCDLTAPAATRSQGVTGRRRNRSPALRAGLHHATRPKGSQPWTRSWGRAAAQRPVCESHPGRPSPLTLGGFLTYVAEPHGTISRGFPGSHQPASSLPAGLSPLERGATSPPSLCCRGPAVTGWPGLGVGPDLGAAVPTPALPNEGGC